MFITSAYAQGTAQVASGGNASAIDFLTPMLPIVLILLVFYIFVFRPMDQQKKGRESLMSTMKKGDEVVTTGGLIGKVNRVEEDEIVLDLAEGVRVRVLRSAIAGLHGASLPDEAAAKVK